MCLYLLPEWFGAADPLLRHAHHLSRARDRPRQLPGEDRRPAGLQPHVVCRCGAARRGHRPADSLPHVPGHLRPPGRQALRQNGEGHPDFERAASARDAALAARGQRRAAQRRDRLHLRRRADHAHRPTASLPPRTGAHHEGRRCSHHSGEPRRRVGQHLQL